MTLRGVRNRGRVDVRGFGTALLTDDLFLGLWWCRLGWNISVWGNMIFKTAYLRPRLLHLRCHRIDGRGWRELVGVLVRMRALLRAMRAHAFDTRRLAGRHGRSERATRSRTRGKPGGKGRGWTLRTYQGLLLSNWPGQAQASSFMCHAGDGGRQTFRLMM